MNKVAVATRLEGELKDLRKGPGISAQAIARTRLLQAIFKNRPGEARKHIEWLLADWPDARKAEALRHAYGIKSGVGCIDLTDRREFYASLIGQSTRTVINHEDETIQRLALSLIDEFMRSPANEELREAIAEVDRSSGWQETGSARATIESVPGALEESSVLLRKSLERAQQLEREVAELRSELERANALNQMLARLFGGD
ncbi:hypothetical protein F6X56_15280 [Rhodococcus erythropolis]|uniref:hypothetical protein n=1 Tax=Rhodococcus erythropolis TaxID=1833 RepID=UPI001245D25D|nr:hypothetical protein [Rhodococcus erythropolis]QEX10985.1 hypothetical protein F6X56_15280 [Rhodococcus erythropolis]